MIAISTTSPSGLTYPILARTHRSEPGRIISNVGKGWSIQLRGGISDCPKSSNKLFGTSIGNGRKGRGLRAVSRMDAVKRSMLARTGFQSAQDMFEWSRSVPTPGFRAAGVLPDARHSGHAMAPGR